MPGIEVLPNQITFSQSWLNAAMLCPQQAFLEMKGELPRIESDATAMGSAMHAAIEHVLGGGTLVEGEAVAIDKFDELSALDEFRWVQVKTRDTALRTTGRIYWEWANSVYPTLPGVHAIEHKFNVPIGNVDGVALKIRGAIDFIDELGDVWDWKSGARPYEQWEVDRFKLQPTVYTYALAWESGDFETIRNFHYAVMFKNKPEHAIYSTVRWGQHWDWLKFQCESIATMILADLDRWHTNDQHALCSQKWCGAWSQCKGKFL